MSTLVGIVGQSGTGKSTSIETLDPKNTVIINVSNKPLPFKGWKSKFKEGKLSEGANYVSTDSASTIVQALKYISDNRKDVKHIVLDDKITLEGLFTIVLFTEVKMEDDKLPHYYFVTQTDGVTTAKSPKGMFDEIYIPNDLNYVSTKIDEYYN